MKPNLFEYELAQGSFHAHRQKFSLRNLVIGTLCRCSPQKSVLTRQQHLNEVVIVQFFVLVQVEILNHRAEVVRLQLSEAVLPLELAQGKLVDQATVLPVNPFEGCVWLKLPHLAKQLSEFLYLNLLLRRVDEDVP